MVRKCLCVGALVITLLLQSIAVYSADSNEPVKQDELSLQQTQLEQEQEQFKKAYEQLMKEQEQLKLDKEELNKAQEQLKNDQNDLKSKQEQLNNAQEQLKTDQNSLKDEQEQLKKDQEQLKKNQEKLIAQTNPKDLYSEINSNTYLNYLKKLGYYKKIYPNDETLNIRNTLLLFQSNHNMSVTGKWDDATKAMLITRLLSLDFKYSDSVKKAPTTGKWIVINKTKRILTLYEGTKVLKKYAVAVGNPSSLTKSGKFTITSKLINPDWGGGDFSKPIKGGIPENPLGSRWLGINRTDGSYGIHGTNSFNSIGTYASHGCIRMQNYCVEELFPLVPMKSSVWVGTQTELKKWGITQNTFVLQASEK